MARVTMSVISRFIHSPRLDFSVSWQFLAVYLPHNNQDCEVFFFSHLHFSLLPFYKLRKIVGGFSFALITHMIASCRFFL